jgi:Spy/CpxP family protein refolding chaperone
MKTNKSKLFALIALGGLMAVGSIARADDAPTQTPPATPPSGNAGGRANMREQAEKLFTAIKATDDQKEKLKAIFKERNEKFKALRDDTSISQEDRTAKRKDITKDVNAKVKDVLSADQYEQYLAFQKEQGHRGRKGADQPATTPPADSTPKN